MVTNFFQILENDNEGTSLYVNDNTTLRKFAGYQDVNLKILEKISDVRINLRGNLITLKGKSEKVKIVVKTIDMLLRKTEGKNNLEEEDIKSFYKCHLHLKIMMFLLLNQLVIAVMEMLSLFDYCYCCLLQLS